MSDEYDPMPSSRRPPKQTPTTIGNHKLSAATLMMGYGYDPALSRRLAESADLPDFDLRVRDAAHGKRFFEGITGKRPAAALPRGWSIRASTVPTRKSSRTGCRSGRMPSPP